MSSVFKSVTVPLTGMNLVEAAAGTGKTHNIQNLVARLILERALSVEEIVVLSFTNEAAAELGQRIRQILDDILSLLEGIPVQKPDQAQELIDHDRAIRPDISDGERIKAVRNALRDFDLAYISTINGFCQKLLGRFAFEGNLAFDSALETDPQRMIVELLEDWMRNRFYGGGKKSELISALVSQHDIENLKHHVLDFNLTIPEYEEIDLAGELDKLIDFYNRGNEFAWLNEEMFAKRSRFVRHHTAFENALTACDYVTILDLADGFTPERLVSDALKKFKSEVESAVDEPFFQQCVRIGILRGKASAALKADAIRFARRRFQELERNGNYMTFADQIRLVDEALQSSGELRTKLQEKFKAGIIDEFQDTDAAQYRIFRSLFDRQESCAFLVGDPRQAIYRFRGGDINAYLRAKQDILRNGNIYYLDVNYRSSVQMVNEVNAIFGNRYKPFGDIDIDFPELASRPAEEAPELLRNGTPAPRAMIRHCSNNAGSIMLLWGCAQRIGEMISGKSGETFPDGSPVCPGDIAVLMRSNAECVQMQSILEYYNIPAVCLKSGNIYADIEAYALYQVLRGTLEPTDRKKVSSALAAFLCNVPLAELDVRNPAGKLSFAGYMEHFRKMNQLWYQHGFIVMFEYFLDAFKVRENLASRHDGERRLTNLYQLGELLHIQAQTLQMPPGVLTERFGDMIARSSDPLYHDDEHEELISSGDSAVRIMTIHASKGLQFPVVMLPGLQKLPASAGRELDGVCFDGKSRVLNLDGDPEYKQIEAKEICEEKIRLIYVALTRARYRCEIFESSALPESAWSNLIDPVRNKLYSLAWNFDYGDCRLPHRESELVPEIPDIPEVRLQWQLTSYSALTRDVSSGNAASPVDHDEDSGGNNDSTDNDPGNETVFSPFTLPGGAGFGTALHEIFERIDFAGEKKLFQQAAVTLLKRSGHQELYQLRGYPEAVGLWLHGIFHTVLRDCCGKEFTLSEIPERDRMTEMEFYCGMKEFDLNKLPTVLGEYAEREFGTVHWPDRWDGLFAGGILNGFIDLVFRRDGRYYIVDWKSNSLGGRPDNFMPERVPDAMVHSFYFLQYMFYLVALVRYLRHFNNGVFGEKEYGESVGGVYYLFVRGMTPHQPQRGVFQARPPWQVIHSLEELICSRMK